jgi:hypothetical protein
MNHKEYPDWFSPYAKPLFAKHLSVLAGKPRLRFLQIGAFTGDVSAWLMDNILTAPRSALCDVDTWEGSDENEHDAFDWADVEATYDRKVDRPPYNVVKFKGTSEEFFAQLQPRAIGAYDFIYIDGDHSPATVLADGASAYRVLKAGGLLAFDDYPWVNPRTGTGPGVAIDAIEACFKGRLQLMQSGAQAWFRKTA